METQKFAFIPEEYQSQDIRWLRISPNTDKTGGVFILLYHDLSKSSLYDYWFENINIAQQWAEESYGIKEQDWRTRESLENDGMQIIDEG